uniref:ATP synthase complex subunit 8 n=1 Tax=Polynemus paradiseus TaxID=463598 RepID=A0A0B6VJS8_9TELE|nr:ATPase subunit 8 [Polynemus paradiseus]BAQ20933.1 ATPase subunit 8 [Polynemus paradiseus]
MPQLNPAPWFYILVASWLILTAMVLPKILNYVFPNEPNTQDTIKTKKDSWLWPWH